MYKSTGAFSIDTDIHCLSHTDPEVQSVQLFGSWDNFTASYPMERDLRRGQGEWKGCYTFKDIIASDQDQDLAKIRNGGLKMGATYYYYVSPPSSALHITYQSPFTPYCFLFPFYFTLCPSFFLFVSRHIQNSFGLSAQKSF